MTPPELPHVPSPPLAPEQIALVRLLQTERRPGGDYIEEWRALFQGAMIRARTSRGRKVTVRLEDVEALLAAGVIASGHGGSFVLTEVGKEL